MFKRKERHGVLINLTDHCVQLARLGRLDSPADRRHVRRGLGLGRRVGGALARRQFRRPRRESSSPPTAVSPVGADLPAGRDQRAQAGRPGIPLQRRSPSTRRSSPQRPGTWRRSTPTTGCRSRSSSNTRTALFLGVPWSAAREAQVRLRDWGVRPRRLELGTPVLLGGLTRYAEPDRLPPPDRRLRDLPQPDAPLPHRQGRRAHAASPAPRAPVDRGGRHEGALGARRRQAARKLLEQPTDELKAPRPPAD
jgi:hypothetical protein